LLPALVSGVSAEEVSNYTSDRFTHEPGLWRVHVRTIRSLLKAIGWTTVQGDKAVWAMRKAEYLFLSGLFSVALALAMLIVVVTF
jgi:hypothetical protein